MVNTILAHPYFIELVLPFLLVFTLIFAILEKTKILGDNKKQINAIIGFVVALILVAFQFPRSIIVNLMPILAIAAVVMLVFLLLYSFAGGKPDEKWVKITFGILVGLVLIVSLLFFTGGLDFILNNISQGLGQDIAINAFFIIVIVVAIILVTVGKNKNSSDSD